MSVLTVEKYLAWGFYFYTTENNQLKNIKKKTLARYDNIGVNTFLSENYVNNISNLNFAFNPNWFSI